MISSKPYLSKFDPSVIPYQKEVLTFLRSTWDMDKGAPEILLSGSVGSSKSALLAHTIVTHCLMNKGACALIGRENLKDVKETILKEVINHISHDLKENVHWKINKNDNEIKFINGSRIVYRSWGDGNAEQFKSMKLSAAAIEEATENRQPEIYEAIYSRIGRTDIPMKENFLIAATNPDSPTHWLYKRFNLGDRENANPARAVWYSKTIDNPFLPKWYIENLKENYDVKMYRRMVLGLWEEIKGEVVYHAYERSDNFKNEIYELNPTFPLDLSFDFNIAEGKPMSAVCSQFDGKLFHFKKTFIVHGARTEQIMEEMVDVLNSWEGTIRVFGDSSGKARDTRSIKSDYDIIKSFLSNYKKPTGESLKFDPKDMLVPISNPPVRERHNTANALFKNSLSQVSVYVYKEASDLDEGFRLTKLKSGGKYIEDDTFEKQHVTTAATYMLHYLKTRFREQRSAYTR